MIRTYGAYAQLWSVDSTNGTPEQLTSGPFDVEKFWLATDGSRVAWSGANAQGRMEIRVAALGGRVLGRVQEVMTNVGAPDSVALSEVREIEWPSNGGLKIRGLLILPLHHHSGTPVPLVVDIHGSGWGSRIYLVGGILVSTSLEWQIWTAKGYAVLVPDYRTAAEYGLHSIRQLIWAQDMNDRDLDDILGGVDYLISDGLVDKTRMVAIGHSAGG